MKQNPTISRATSNLAPTEPARSPALVLIGLVFIVGLGGALFLTNRSKTAAPGQTQAPLQAGVPKAGSAADEVVETTGSAAQTPSITVARIVPRKPHGPEASEPRLPALAETRQLVTSLTQLDFSHGPMMPETVAAWKQTMQQLTAHGVGAVPAIREFLEKNQDLSFDATSAKQLGQSTVRLSMLEALQNIGGPEAMTVSSEILQTTLDPREIAWLAQSLEQQAPGQYGEMAAQAARDALTAAGTGQLEDRDVGVLFGVLQKYGGDDAATDLENFSSQYVYYAVIALANLPDGAGVSSLLDMLRDSEMPGGHAPVLQMLAQAALDSPKALEALKEQARMNQIPTSSWLNIASMLMGDKVEIGSAPADSGPGVRSFHLAISNQNFYTIPDRSQWPPEQVNRYIDVVNQLAAANKNPMAAAALQNALTALQARLQ